MIDQLKIVLINDKDHADISVFSGTPFFMNKALRKEFDVIAEYSPKTVDELTIDSSSKDINYDLPPIGERLSKLLASDDIKPDYIVCVGVNLITSTYNGTIPLVAWHDSTWHTYLRGYVTKNSFSNFKSKCRNLYLFDKAVVNRCDLLIYPSKYIAKACIKNYGVSPKKIKIIPFGANLIQVPSAEILAKYLSDRLSSEGLNLMFLGAEWERKGLHIAVKLTNKLNEIGIKTMLNVVGCEPPAGVCDFPYVKKWGYLKKSDESHLNTLKEIFQRTHFLIHPARSEPFGIALCEANAYGIPVIGTNVEGLKTIIRNGKNGFRFNEDIFVDKAIKTIGNIHADFNRKYTSLFESSLREYNERLNWSSNVTKLKEHLIKQRFMPKSTKL